MGQIQTETAFVLPKFPLFFTKYAHTRDACRYYQPNPDALIPFAPNAAIHDPDFAATCEGKSGNCAVGWGLRVVDSKDINVYGAGLYSFFDNFDAG